jgi:NAD(P)-dependent dehydrogenase (short-subunit alcohol dehydrogenase family)
VTGLYSYAGKRVVVTGGASGVGAALVQLLDTLSSPDVVVLDVHEPAGLTSSQWWLPTDLADAASIAASVEKIGPVDVLFNNAGVAATQSPRIVLAVNYLALRRLSEGLLAQIPAGGAIVNTASIAGGQWPTHLTEINELLDIGDWDKSLEWVEAHTGDVVADSYSFSKEVVRVWSMRDSRSTFAKGVRTNTVCPAPIDTPLLKDFRATMSDKIIDWSISQASGTVMTPRQVAMPLAFLGSAAAAYVNGHDLVADGGFNAAMTTGQVDFSGLA